jgi:cytochrome c-type biogenesis protein
MDAAFVAAGSALWLGILTSISPCPLATNIAAITYIGRQVGRPSRALITGLLYTLGRSLVYVGLAALAVGGVMAIPKLSFFLQDHFNQFLGPILILTGLVLLGLFKWKSSGLTLGQKTQERVAASGMWGGGLLGVLFALSLCPISAALFFGSLIPLAMKQQSPVLIPTIYGIGTALPVVVFAVLIAFGAGYVGGLFNRLSSIERWARLITGALFVLVGLYLSAVYILGWQLM